MDALPSPDDPDQPLSLHQNVAWNHTTGRDDAYSVSTFFEKRRRSSARTRRRFLSLNDTLLVEPVRPYLCR